MTIDAIVLAGGSSSRFGSDKLAAELDGRPLLHRPIEAVGGVARRVVVVIARDGRVPALPAALAGRIVVARDRVANMGPLAGLVAGLEATLAGTEPADAAEPADHADAADIALVVAGDMPTLVPAVLRLLVARLEAEPSLGAASLEAEPPCVLPMALRPAVALPAALALLAEDRRALRALPGRIPSLVVAASDWRQLDPAGRTLADVDTPADLPSRDTKNARPGGRAGVLRRELPGVEETSGRESRSGGRPTGRS